MKYSLLTLALLSAFYIASAKENVVTETIITEINMDTIKEGVVQAIKQGPVQVVKEEPIKVAKIQILHTTPTPVVVQSPPSVVTTIDKQKNEEALLSKSQKVRVNVVGQGVAPLHTISPAQAYALAKRAAIADAYRIIAEKVKGVRVEGQDLVKNMMIKRSTIRTSVNAMVRNANIVETNFKDGLCEVEMEIVLSYTDFSI